MSLRCAGRLRGMSFALYRAGEAAPLQYRDSTESWADFPLPGARAPGTYSCYYHTPSSPYVLSLRSEPLVIRADHGESGAPRPGPAPAPQPGGPSPQPLSLLPNLGVRTLPPPPQIQESRTPDPIHYNFETGSCVPSLTLEAGDREGGARTVGSGAKPLSLAVLQAQAPWTTHRATSSVWGWPAWCSSLWAH